MGETLLVTGASGMVGSAIAQLLTPARDAVLLSHRRRAADSRTPSAHRWLQTDLTRAGSGARWIEELRPRCVLHCAALAQQAQCEREPALATSLNVAASVELAAACREHGAFFVLVSTDLVFDGSTAPYDERAAVNPGSTYARTKVEAETRVVGVEPNAAVVRLPLVVGPSRDGRSGPLDMMRADVAPADGVTLFIDEWRTPLTSLQAGRVLLALAERREGGLWHAGGRERLTRHQLGLRILRAFGWETSIVAAEREERAPHRPRDVSLDSAKLYRALGTDLVGTLDDGLDELKRWSPAAHG